MDPVKSILTQSDLAKIGERELFIETTGVEGVDKAMWMSVLESTAHTRGSDGANWLSKKLKSYRNRIFLSKINSLRSKLPKQALEYLTLNPSLTLRILPKKALKTHPVRRSKWVSIREKVADKGVLTMGDISECFMVAFLANERAKQERISQEKSAALAKAIADANSGMFRVTGNRKPGINIVNSPDLDEMIRLAEGIHKAASTGDFKAMRNLTLNLTLKP